MMGAGTAGLRRRTLILAGVLACAFLGVLVRLAYLQVVMREEYSRLAESQHAKTIPLRPMRGPIVDRRGQPLAVSAAAETLFALPARIDDPSRLARELAPILGEPARDIRKRLDSSRRLVFVKRKLPPAVAGAVRRLGHPGLGFVEESLRLYPHRELAAHAVGFEGMDGRGLAGVEQAWDAHLAGEDGRAVVERDALGREVTAAPRVIKTPRPGRGVMLTIDATLQYIAEREIEAAWRRTRAKAAMAVAVDPRTGEILALAIRPTFNPNGYAASTDEARRNRAITDPFEPGSTFKVILAAAALEERVARPTDRFHGEHGQIRIAGATIHDWKPYGWLTFTEVLQNSSNVGSIKVGLALGKDRFYRHMLGFGFGSPTAVGLAGESRGQLRPPERWSGLSLATMSIGQEVSVTALQLVSAFSAVANGGRLMQPRVVRALLDAEGRQVQGFEPEVVRQVIAPETARALARIMTTVVREGTGRHAAIPGYEVAGKTGTAQKLDPGTRRYSRAPGVLSFAGFVPADDPRLAMLVLLDEPKTERWGSEAAAPIFAAIGREALRHLGVPALDTPPVQIVAGAPPAGGAALRPPAPPIGAATLVSAAGPAAEAAGGPVMPALQGLSLRHAMQFLAALDLPLEVTGQGVVVGQSPPPGAPVAAGTVARLTLASPAVVP
jgi:cell division protein FtsI (penicillin-binding protein 3)